jgi:DNA-binding transcriptional regulator YiaG
MAAEALVSVKEIREAEALSQEAFARRLGVSVRTVARWESGQVRPSPLALEKLRQSASQNRRSEA